MAKRPKPRKTTSPGEFGQLLFNEQAYSQRNVGVGGVWDIIGAAATAAKVGLFAALKVCNPDTAGHWIAVGPAAVAAPSGIANGQYIPPQSCIYISTGEVGDYVRTDSALVGVYKMQESIVIAEDDRAASV